MQRINDLSEINFESMKDNVECVYILNKGVIISIIPKVVQTAESKTLGDKTFTTIISSRKYSVMVSNVLYSVNEFIGKSYDCNEISLSSLLASVVDVEYGEISLLKYWVKESSEYIDNIFGLI